MTTTHGQFGPHGPAADDAGASVARTDGDTDPQAVLESLGSGFDALFTHEAVDSAPAVSNERRRGAHRRTSSDDNSEASTADPDTAAVDDDSVQQDAAGENPSEEAVAGESPADLDGPTDHDGPPADGDSGGSRWRKPVLVGAAAVVCALVIGGGTVAAMHKTVKISVDGVSQDVSTLAGSVAGALDSAGLTLASHDTLAPTGDAEITDGATIVVQRGRLLTLTIDGQTRRLWTTATTVEQALAQIGQDPASFKLSADRSRAIPLDGLQVSADTLHTVSITLGTKTKEYTSTATTVGALLTENKLTPAKNQRVSLPLTAALTDGAAITIRTLPTVKITAGKDAAKSVIVDGATVAEALAAAKVRLGPDDTVKPGVKTPLKDGQGIVVTRISFVTAVERQPIEQPADETRDDDSQLVGTTTVVQEGAPGVAEVTYKTKVTNGAKGPRQEISRKTVTAAKPQIVAIGTKQPPPPPVVAAPKPAPAAPEAAPAPKAAAPPAAHRPAPAGSCARAGTCAGAGTRSGARAPGTLGWRLRGELGRDRQLRVDQQLVHQHR